METVPSFLKARKNAIQGNYPWAWLFDIHRDASNVSRYTDDNAEIVYAGNTYLPRSIEWEPPYADAGGTLRPFAISIGDADRAEMAYLMNDKYRKRRLRAMLVNVEDLSSGNHVECRGKILSAGWSRLRAVLRIGIPDLRKGVFPGISLYALRCENRWKDWRCKYAGSIATPCDLSYFSCRDIYLNEANFHGAPGMPSLRP